MHFLEKKVQPTKDVWKPSRKYFTTAHHTNKFVKGFLNNSWKAHFGIFIYLNFLWNVTVLLNPPFIATSTSSDRRHEMVDSKYIFEFLLFYWIGKDEYKKIDFNFSF